MPLLYRPPCSIRAWTHAIGRPSASVRLSAASAIVRTSPARSISRRFKAAASVNARAPSPPTSSTPTRLRRVLHAEDAPHAGQRTAQRCFVIEIALDDFDAVARQRRRPLAVRLAREAAQMEPGALQRVRDRAALMACHSGDENRSIAGHRGNLIKSLARNTRT